MDINELLSGAMQKLTPPKKEPERKWGLMDKLSAYVIHQNQVPEELMQKASTEDIHNLYEHDMGAAATRNLWARNKAKKEGVEFSEEAWDRDNESTSDIQAQIVDTLKRYYPELYSQPQQQTPMPMRAPTPVPGGIRR